MKPVLHLSRFVVLIGVLVARELPAVSNDAITMQQALSGDVVPLKLAFKDLDEAWRRFSSGDAGGGATGGMGVYLAMLGASHGSTFYTKGEVKTISGEPFLVAYQQQSKPIDLQLMLRGGMRPDQMKKPEPPTADTPLALALIHLRTADNFTEIQPFNLERELAGGDDSPEALEKGRQEAARAAGLDNLRQLGIAVMAYAQDGKKTLPPMDTPDAARQALKPYVGGKDVFQSDTGGAYLPNSFLSGKKLTAIDKPATMVAFYEEKPSNGTRGVLFLDGHVVRVSEDKWTDLKEASQIR